MPEPPESLEATASKILLCSCQILNLGIFAPGNDPCGPVFISCTNDWGSGYESGLSRTVLMTEKTAVFAPIPTAMTKTAMAVNPGIFLSERTAKRRSRQIFSTQGKEF